jgi:hypothetical protein
MYMGSASSSLKEGRVVDFGSCGRLSATDADVGVSLLAAGEGDQVFLGDALSISIVSNLFPSKGISNLPSSTW